jgi:hypothetical protein
VQRPEVAAHAAQSDGGEKGGGARGIAVHKNRQIGLEG